MLRNAFARQVRFYAQHLPSHALPARGLWKTRRAGQFASACEQMELRVVMSADQSLLGQVTSAVSAQLPAVSHAEESLGLPLAMLSQSTTSQDVPPGQAMPLGGLGGGGPGGIVSQLMSQSGNDGARLQDGKTDTGTTTFTILSMGTSAIPEFSRHADLILLRAPVLEILIIPLTSQPEIITAFPGRGTPLPTAPTQPTGELTTGLGSGFVGGGTISGGIGDTRQGPPTRSPDSNLPGVGTPASIPTPTFLGGNAQDGAAAITTLPNVGGSAANQPSLFAAATPPLNFGVDPNAMNPRTTEALEVASLVDARFARSVFDNFFGGGQVAMAAPGAPKPKLDVPRFDQTPSPGTSAGSATALPKADTHRTVPTDADGTGDEGPLPAAVETTDQARLTTDDDEASRNSTSLLIGALTFLTGGLIGARWVKAHRASVPHRRIEKA